MPSSRNRPERSAAYAIVLLADSLLLLIVCPGWFPSLSALWWSSVLRLGSPYEGFALFAVLRSLRVQLFMCAVFRLAAR